MSVPKMIERVERDPAIRAMEEKLPPELRGFGMGAIARWAADHGHGDAFRAYLESITEMLLGKR